MAEGIAVKTEADLEEIGMQVRTAAKELLEKAHFDQSDIFVLGCSSSEITGHRI